MIQLERPPKILNGNRYSFLGYLVIANSLTIQKRDIWSHAGNHYRSRSFPTSPCRGLLMNTKGYCGSPSYSRYMSYPCMWMEKHNKHLLLSSFCILNVVGDYSQDKRFLQTDLSNWYFRPSKRINVFLTRMFDEKRFYQTVFLYTDASNLF